MTSSSMPWQLLVARQVEEKLRRLVPKDQRLVLAAIDRLRADPLACSLEELKGPLSGFRMRVGDWRLLLDLDPAQRLVSVADLQRRTTTTYRRRH